MIRQKTKIGEKLKETEKNMSDILFGITAIVFGIYMIWSTSKKPPIKPLSSITFQGYTAGIIFIMIGIVLIIKKIL